MSPDRPILPGQIYSTLQRLERDGRIKVAAVEQDEGPERRRFALTDLHTVAVPNFPRADQACAD